MYQRTKPTAQVLYGEDAIVEVEGADDFIDKLRYYIENESARQQIARIGYELGHREFNERLVSQYPMTLTRAVIEATLGLPFSHPYRWPTESFTARFG